MAPHPVQPLQFHIDNRTNLLTHIHFTTSPAPTIETTSEPHRCQPHTLTSVSFDPNTLPKSPRKHRDSYRLIRKEKGGNAVCEIRLRGRRRSEGTMHKRIARVHIQEEEEEDGESNPVVYHVTSNHKTTILIFQDRNLSRWMDSVSPELMLSSLTIPGSHETCSLYGYPFSTCHSGVFIDHLNAGLRFLDLRLSLPDGPDSAPKVYHGIQSQHYLFSTFIQLLKQWLLDHPSEAVIVSIKQEDGVKGFEDAVYKQIEEFGQDWWWVEPRIPKLGEVRGKAVMFSRFGSRVNNGIHLPIWPNNSRESWKTSVPDSTTVVVQDWYDINSPLSIPEKAALVISSLTFQTQMPDIPNPEMPSQWLITYLSASALILFGYPFVVAKGVSFFNRTVLRGVNERVVQWWVSGSGANEADEGTGGMKMVKGAVVLCDYWEVPGDGLLARLAVESNFD